MQVSLAAMDSKATKFLTQASALLTWCSIAAIPLKLSLTYCFLFPAILSTLYLERKTLRAEFTKVLPQLKPFYLFILFILIAAPFGIDFGNSVTKILKLLVLSLCIFSFLKLFNRSGLIKPFLILISAQAIAALHSILEFFWQLPSIFLGAVTESGQLAMTIPVTLGILLTSKKDLPAWGKKLIGLLLATLILALIFNLKRGPWLGAGVGTLLILLIHRPKALWAVVTTIILALALFAPVRERLLNTREHFAIAGGRQVMWSIAGDLATRYPMGVGYGNSRVLQRFAREIPPEHKHFHSNYLNILVETGYIGFVLFCAWLISLISHGLRNSKHSRVSLAFTCAILSWAIAGIVEYNFGDSEVILLVFLILAGIIHINKTSSTASKSEGICLAQKT